MKDKVNITRTKIPLIYKEMPIYKINKKEVEQIGTKIFWSRDFLNWQDLGSIEGVNYLWVKVINQDESDKDKYKECIVRKNDIEFLLGIFKGEIEPVPEVTKGMLALLMAIIEDAATDFRLAWQNGQKNRLYIARKFLEEEKISKWTLDQFHRDFIIENLEQSCLKMYGSFEEIYKRKYDHCMEHLTPIYDELELFDREHLIDTRLTKEEAHFFREREHKSYISLCCYRKIKAIEEDLVYEKTQVEDEEGNLVWKDIIPLNDHNIPLLEKLTKYKKIKQDNSSTQKEVEYYNQLLAKIELTSEEKARVKYLEKKAEPWENKINE